VAAGTVVEGVVAPKLERLNGLQRSLAGSAVMAQLTPDEREVYALLAEYGEMTARDLAEADSSPLFKVMSLLHSLEKQEFVLSTQDVPKRYALTREEQHVPRRILFVDQRQESREVFDMVFTMEGHSLRLACDGDEAVAAVHEERFDAIVLDATLPDQDGWTAVRLIRELENGRTTPILMFNAADDHQAQERRRELGADGYFAKPLVPEELLPHVIRLIRRD
jgi:CheY-like chemotaxis protein